MQYILSVSEVNRYIKELISADLILGNLWVRGEISNYKCHYSGHLYFTIKDEKSLLKCVMFKSQAERLRFTPENGMKVLVRGYISVFERDGQYQLYAEEMQPDGIGALHIAFEQLKKKLKEEGLFDEKRKKKIPLIPKSIGIVTSITGAVIRDILNILGRRFPTYSVKIFPVQVQGEGAAQQISYAIKKLNEMSCVDVIIVARGGGSLEELWAFNEEIVARSIYESKIPVISAVGHETDYTISDFVADLRAPTPSAAAELVLPEKQSLRYMISNIEIRITNAVKKVIHEKRLLCEKYINSVAFKHPYNLVYQNRMKVDVLEKYLHKAVRISLENAGRRLNLAAGKLDALSPLKTLSRGYCITRSKQTGMVIKSIADVTEGEQLEISVTDGIIKCFAEEMERGNICG